MIVKRPDNFFPDLRGFVDMASEGTQAMKETIAGVFCRSAPVFEQERVAPPILVGAEEVQANTLEEATPQRPLNASQSVKEYKEAYSKAYTDGTLQEARDIVEKGSLQEIEEFFERGSEFFCSSYLAIANQRVLSENYSDEAIKILKLVYEKQELNHNYFLLPPVIWREVVPNLEAIKKLIEAGFDPNFRVSLYPLPDAGKGGPVIQRAIMNNDVETVEFLLNRGANPNHPSGWSSILHDALISKENGRGTHYNRTRTFFPNPKILEMLLKAGGNPNAENYKGQTLLECAAECITFGRLKSDEYEKLHRPIELLLLHGADLSKVGPIVPRFIRTCYERVDVVHHLFQKLRLFSHSANDISTS